MIRNKRAGEDRKKNPLFLSYTIFFFFLSIFAFGMFPIYNKTFIWNVDAFYQHYPLLVELRHLVAGAIRGKGLPMMAFNIGLGADTMGSLAIVTMDPFNYIAILFPISHLDIGYSLAVILRMYCAGLAIGGFLKYHSFDKKTCLIGSLSYAFCSWSVGVFCHGFFQLPLILFPILILGIDKVFDGKKPYLLIFGVFASLITYIYFAYMSAIFCLIYLMLRYFTEKEVRNLGVPGFFRWIGTFVLYVGIGVFLSAPVITCVVYTLMNAGKSAGSEIEYFMTLKQWSRWLPSLIARKEVTGNYSFVHINGLCTLLFPFIIWQLIRQWKNRIKLSYVLFLFCFIMTAVPFWGSFMNGFSYSVGRWCYILAFFFVWASMDCMEGMIKEGDSEKKEEFIVLGWCSLLTLSLFFAALITKTFDGADVAEGFLTITCMLLFFYVAKWRKKAVIVVLILNIISFYWVVFSPNLDGMISGFMDQGAPYRVYRQSLLRADKGIDDPDFYRVDYIERLHYSGEKLDFVITPPNENLFWDSRTLFTYLSSLDKRQLYHNKILANSGGYYRRTCVFSNDNRSRLNFLQGVKYFLNENKNCKDYAGYGYTDYDKIDGVNVQQLQISPGLGYVYPSVTSEEKTLEQSPLAIEQILMQSAVVEEKDINDVNAKEVDPENLQYDIEEIQYEISEESEIIPEEHSFEVFNFDNSKKADTRETLLILNIPNIKNSEVYFEFSNLVKTPLTLDEVKEKYMGKEEKADTFIRAYKDYYENNSLGAFSCFIRKDGIKKRFFNAEGEPQALNDQERYLVNLGYFDSIDGEVTITFKTSGKYTYDDLKVYAVSQKHFDAQAGKLSGNRFRMTGQSANTISGNVNSDSDGILYLSLPYNPGWKVYVDDVKTDTFKTNICFTGVNITQGKHDIVIKYRPVGYGISRLLFLIGLAGVIICIYTFEPIPVLKKNTSRKRKDKNEKDIHRNGTI